MLAVPKTYCYLMLRRPHEMGKNGSFPIPHFLFLSIHTGCSKMNNTIKLIALAKKQPMNPILFNVICIFSEINTSKALKHKYV